MFGKEWSGPTRGALTRGGNGAVPPPNDFRKVPHHVPHEEKWQPQRDPPTHAHLTSKLAMQRAM